MKFIANSEDETIKLGEEFAKTLKGGDIVVLNGEMGAGKTAFTKGIAKGLGINAQVLSPTYAYMNDYEGKLFHYDAYKLKSGEEAEFLGLTEQFYMGKICVLEWAENILDVLPPIKKVVSIKKIDKYLREIEW